MQSIIARSKHNTLRDRLFYNYPNPYTGSLIINSLGLRAIILMFI